jgi:hypothetical protein
MFDEAQPWREKILRTLEHNYRRSAAFDVTFPLIEELVRNPEPRVAAYNDANARRLLDVLGLEAQLVRSSALPTEGHGTERLIELTRAVGGSVYMSGDGAAGYLDDRAFAGSGVELRFQEYLHPRYDQGRPFVAGLSVVDAVFRCGVDGTRALLLGG